MTRTLALSLALSLAAANAWAGNDSNTPRVSASLDGYNEIPIVSTLAGGSFKARIDDSGQAIDWELSFEGLQGNVTQAHLHFGQRFATGGIVVWLCGTAAAPPPASVATVTPTCPQGGSISGTILPNHIMNQPAQGIVPGEFAELVAAIRSGNVYANVHSSSSPAGEIRGQLRRGGGHDHDDNGKDK